MKRPDESVEDLMVGVTVVWKGVGETLSSSGLKMNTDNDYDNDLTLKAINI